MPAIAASTFHQACLVVMVPLLQDVFDLTLSMIGVVVGTGLMATAISLPAWGRVEAYIGALGALRIILSFAVLSVSAIAISFLLVSYALISPLLGLAVLITARVAYSITVPALLPLTQAILARNTQNSSKLLTPIGRLSSMTGLGRLAGNAAVAPLLLLGGAAPLVAPIPVYAVCLFFAFKQSSPATIKRPKSREQKDRFTLPKTALLIGFALQLCLGATYVLLGPLIKDSMQLDSTEATTFASYCLTAAVLSGLVAQLGLLPIFRKHTSIVQITSAMSFTAGLTLLCVAHTLPFIAMSAAIIGASAALLSATNSVYLLKQLPASFKAKGSTTLSCSQFAGLATGSILGGFGGEASLTLTFSFATLIALVFCVGGSGFVISHKPVARPLRPSDI
ncbi:MULTISPECIES: MFS transporter [unclassified Pseudovibrio]|uniref:MFS transporter n=1 Tax=unclassified Pseudovibrio TaxID=2627060 RepID=UPI0007AEA055|nr:MULTISPECIES: MFS transporter [unclassified Pseudovibrio]KZK94459.1 Major Facilitator Superfamily protein [Pseudovibrio sp. W74]KZL07221.1 Major Facilitator Superfamily protein [Pseudovibrio sp. Ad14]